VRNKRDLFQIRRGGTLLAVAVRGGGALRTYIGSINGEECATAREKGELLRMLFEMVPSYRATSQPPSRSGSVLI